MAVASKKPLRKKSPAKSAPTNADLKRADLAGPGIGTYEDLEKVLPTAYRSLLDVRETQRAIFAVKDYIEEHLCKELNLMMVTVPLIVDVESGVNDMLDRDGSRTPIQFHISNDHDKHPIDAQVVQAATKWKRVALKQLGMAHGEGLCTDMRAVRKDYFLDHDHSCYVDQWDWERVISAEERSLDFLTRIVRKIWKVIKGAEQFAMREFPKLRDPRWPELPHELTFLHAEDILDRFPDLPRKKRETAILQDYPAVFIYGIGWPLALQDRPPGARPQRRHPGLEPGDRAPSRADVDGHPGERRDAEAAARDEPPAPPAEDPVPPGDREARAAAQHRRRDRAEPDAHAAAAQGTPRRGERDGVAEDPERDVREEAYLRARVIGSASGALRRISRPFGGSGVKEPSEKIPPIPRTPLPYSKRGLSGPRMLVRRRAAMKTNVGKDPSRRPRGRAGTKPACKPAAPATPGTLQGRAT